MGYLKLWLYRKLHGFVYEEWFAARDVRFLQTFDRCEVFGDIETRFFRKVMSHVLRLRMRLDTSYDEKLLLV